MRPVPALFRRLEAVDKSVNFRFGAESGSFERGPALRKLGGYDIEAVSPGRLVGGCEIASDAAVARCRIGKGRAIVVADADFLDTARLGKPAQHNLDGLLAELAALERR